MGGTYIRLGVTNGNFRPPTSKRCIIITLSCLCMCMQEKNQTIANVACIFMYTEFAFKIWRINSI